MIHQYQINVKYKSKERQIVNVLLTLATGILTLIYPSFLYLIVGGYLVALALIFLFFRVPAFLAAFPLTAGILVILFPELIPITFAIFLGFFGLILLFSFGFTILGIITLILSYLIYTNPDSVAYLIAAFLLLYGTSNLIRLFQSPKKKSDLGSGDPNEVSVQ